jgi:hypothetical protein
LKSFLLIILSVICIRGWSQAEKKSMVVGTLTSKPNALLIVNPPDGDQGVLLPQLTTAQRLAITPSTEENGLLVFDTEQKTFYFWKDTAWIPLSQPVSQIEYYTIDPVDFQVLKSDGKADKHNLAVFETDNTFVTASKDAEGESVMASLHLPNGSTIKEITVYYADNGIGNIGVQVLRKDLATGLNQVIGTWTSLTNALNLRTATLGLLGGTEVIQNDLFTYRILVNFDIQSTIDRALLATQRIYAIRIAYQQ